VLALADGEGPRGECFHHGGTEARREKWILFMDFGPACRNCGRWAAAGDYKSVAFFLQESDNFSLKLEKMSA
jgi:hypothetical protein